jgi:hypothetical protein
LFALLTTALGPLGLWLVKLKEARIWRHHHPKDIEFVDHGMLFVEECYPVHQMLKHIRIHGKTDIRYINSCPGDALHIADDAFQGSNSLTS